MVEQSAVARLGRLEAELLAVPRAGALEVLGRQSRRHPGGGQGRFVAHEREATNLFSSRVALPLYDWMNVTVTMLERHPNDPGPEVTVSADAGNDR